MSSFLVLVTGVTNSVTPMVTPVVTPAVTAQSRLELSGYGGYTSTHARTCEEIFSVFIFCLAREFFQVLLALLCYLIEKYSFFSFLGVTAGVTTVTGGV